MNAPEPVTLEERPPAGPARGALASPVWLVVLSTTALVLLCAFALVRSWRQRFKGTPN